MDEEERQEQIEQELVDALSKVLLSSDDVDGLLDEDLIQYISGMLTSQIVVEHEDVDTSVDEVLVPFLESVHCPDTLADQSRQIVIDVLSGHAAAAGSGDGDGPGSNSNKHDPSSANKTRKLTQGIVNMASDLTKEQSAAEQDANRYLWGTDSGVKAMANDIIDAHQDKASAKDKRKARKLEAERERQLLSSKFDTDVDELTDGHIIKMNVSQFSGNAAADKKKDVLVKNVTVSLPNGTILIEHNSELKLSYQRRYGLIGENGTGKSTLLKAIANQQLGTNNEKELPKHLRILHVRQEVPSHIDMDQTVLDAVLSSDLERETLIERERAILAKLEAQDENSSHKTSSDAGAGVELTIKEKMEQLENNKKKNESNTEFAKDMKQLDEIYHRLHVLNADQAESRAVAILTGLQFSVERRNQTLSSLSGGWKMRVALAAALFIEPDICMLDEPTNHLDLEAVLWLETYLQSYKHTLLVVSHDRSFLNEVCTDIIELKHKKLTYYRGNYDTAVKLRQVATQNAMRQYQAYQQKRDHMMEFIEKFRANAKRASIVQSRIKAVEKMDAEAPEPVVQDQLWRFSIPNSEPLSRPIISINDVCFDYKAAAAAADSDGETKTSSEDQLSWLLQKVNFGVDLDSKIAILGANGQGKTTLLNLIMQKIQPMKGSVSINTGLRIGHFTQHSGDNFDLSISAVENMLNLFESAEDQEMRTFLGKFQIQGNDALKPMMLLSGGQKSRVAFAALAYKKPHVLVIDEGSNHLSMDAVDALIEALQDFKGGILIVSHDEYFVSKTCQELWVVDNGQVSRFRGDFNEYKKHTAELTQKRVEESVLKLGSLQ